MLYLLYLVLHLLQLLLAQELHVNNTVITADGPIQGKAMSVWNGQFYAPVNVYHGIPYAKPPVDELRFKSPEEPDPWTDLYMATELPRVCPQDPTLGLIAFTHPTWLRYGEDCLYLDVYSPYDTTDAPYPVMVWFHGGAFQSGANIQYPGHFLATYGLVIVTVNYRLGNFGFLYTGDDAAPGNAGMFDQKMALEWVQTNIAEFGGDPNMVTIFGQSAGAASSGLHSVSPQTQHLFHQVILESGSDMNLWSVLNPDSDPASYSVQLAEYLGCPTGDNHVMVECLRQADWRDIRDVTINCTEGYFCLGMQPVIDGPGGFMPDWPRLLRDEGLFAKVPSLSGICRDDGSLYTYVLVEDPGRPGGFDRYNFTKHLRQDLVELVAGFLPEELFELFYHELDYNYAPWPYIDDGHDNLLAFNDLITDGAFGVPWDYHMMSQSQAGVPAYGYVFDFRSSNATSLIPLWMGVPHTGEMPYVWGYSLLDDEANEAVREDSQIFDIIDWNEDDDAITVYFMQMIANFAKYGNPTPEAVPLPFDAGNTTWLPYSVTDMNYLYVDQETPYTDVKYRQQDYALYLYLVPTTTGFMFDSSMLLNPASGSPTGAAPSQFDPRVLKERITDLYTEAYPERAEILMALFSSIPDLNPTPEAVPLPFDAGNTTWLPYSVTDMNYLYVDQETPYTDVKYRQQNYALYLYLVPTTTGFMFDSSMLLNPASGSPTGAAPSQFDPRVLKERITDLYTEAYPERAEILTALFSSIPDL